MTPQLTWILCLPVAAALLLIFVPARKKHAIRDISRIIVAVTSLLAIWAFASYDHTVGGYQMVEKKPWVEPLGISYHLGLDGINSVMLLLVAISSLAAVLISGSIKERVKEYYISFLLIITGTYGAFMSLDIFFFYFFHEVAAIPVYLLIAIWGSARKDYAAMKLTLYLTAGASLALIGLISLYKASK